MPTLAVRVFELNDPAAALAIHAGAQFYRFLRAEMLIVLQREHIMVARAKGASTRHIVTAHALPNAFGPVLTQIGVQIGVLVASAVVVESIFGLPGIGSYMFYAVEQRDIYAVLGAVLIAYNWPKGSDRYRRIQTFVDNFFPKLA